MKPVVKNETKGDFVFNAIAKVEISGSEGWLDSKTLIE